MALSSLDVLGKAVNTLGSLAGGIGGVVSGYQQAQAQRSEAQMNIDNLDMELDRLLETYNENQKELEASLDQSISAGNQGIWATSVAQGNALRTSSASNAQNQASLYEQLAEVQRQGMQSEGVAVQTAAVSGFRDSGTVRSNIDATRRASARSYETARGQVQLSAYQGYMKAAEDYFSSNVQIESYRESMRNARENYSLRTDALKSQYDYQKKQAQNQKEYWEGVYDESEYTFWDGVADFFGGAF